MLVQVNARVPEKGRDAMLSVAARLREDDSFIKRLLSFLEDDAGGSPYEDRLAALEERVRVLEIAKASAPSLGDGAVQRGAGQLSALQGVPADAQATAIRPALQDEPAVGVGQLLQVDWQSRAKAITISTGEGRGRKLTPEGIALFDDMVRAGVSNPEISRVLGLANQTVWIRVKKLKARA